jgi:hypothetical protein
MPRRKYAIALLIALVLTLSGCTRFIYNHADWLISWYIDDYIDFNRTQKKIFRNYLDSQLEWHRQHELPRYKRFMEQLLVDINKPMTVEQMQQRSDESVDFWTAIMSNAMPGMAQQFLDLSEQQARHFLSQIEKEQRSLEYDQQHSSLEDSIKRRIESTEKSFGRFIGRLTDEQSGILANWAQQTHEIYPATIAQRSLWQEQLIKTFAKRRENPQQFRSEIFDLFVHADRYWTASYQQLMEKNQRVSYKMLVDIQHSLTDKQLRKLQKTLKNYIKDISKLVDS